MKDWGTLDLPAALAALKHAAGAQSVVGVGHSFGGVALGLSNRSGDFERYTMLASLSGYYRNTAEPLAVFARMNLLGVPLTIPLGKLPKWGGLGEALPGSVFRDWARWCRNPNFLFADPKVPEARYFQEVRTPILSVGITDDVWGTRKAVDSLLIHYSNAAIRDLWLSPDQRSGPVGHLGFFRKQHETTLWPAVINWLLKATCRKVRLCARRHASPEWIEPPDYVGARNPSFASAAPVHQSIRSPFIMR